MRLCASHSALHRRRAIPVRYNCTVMGVTVELENLRDVQLCQEIVARVEHAFSDRKGEWRMSIAGSRESESWEMRVAGPNGFERTYTLSRAAGEHTPEAIGRLILQLVPASPS